MPRPVELIVNRDFSGGLNLRSDQFQLGPNESPEMLNMDVDPRGGVRSRWGVAPYMRALPATEVYDYGLWHSTTADRLWVSDDDGDAWLYSDATGLWSSLATGGGAPWTGVQFRGSLYLVNGVDQSREWNGSAAANLGETYASDFAAPSTDKMPRARQIAVHQNHVWLADTLESSTRHASRLRFSHPGTAEAWRSLDWIDLDPGVNDEAINNLIPYQDHILAFKETATYAIFGYGWDSWTNQSVSKVAGAVAHGAACATPAGVFFFSWPDGVYRWDGRRLSWMFERLVPAIRDGSIPESRRDEIRMGWADSRLWVSVPWGVSDFRTFVLDPSLGRDGAWVMYDVEIGQVRELDGRSTGATPVAPLRGGSTLLDLVRYDQPYDDLGVDEGGIIEALFDTLDWPTDTIARVADEFTIGGDDEPADNVGNITDIDYGLTFDIEVPADAQVAQVIAWGSTAGSDNYVGLIGYLDVNGRSNIEVVLGEGGDPTELAVDGVDVFTVEGSTSGTTTILAPSRFSKLTQFNSDTRTPPVPGGVMVVFDKGRRPIQTTYRTRWFDADVDAMKKRFRRMWVTYWGDGEGEIVGDVFHNFDSSRRVRGWSETIVQQGDTPTWGAVTWGAFEWGGAGTNHAIRRAITLGNAHSVQLRFRGPALEQAPWGLESITLPFQRRRVR